MLAPRRTTTTLLLTLLLCGAGGTAVRAESEWLGSAFPDKRPAAEKVRRPSPPAAAAAQPAPSKPSKSATQIQQEEDQAEARRERARRQQAEREVEKEAAQQAEIRRKATAAKTKLEAQARHEEEARAAVDRTAVADDSAAETANKTAAPDPGGGHSTVVGGVVGGAGPEPAPQMRLGAPAPANAQSQSAPSPMVATAKTIPTPPRTAAPALAAAAPAVAPTARGDHEPMPPQPSPRSNVEPSDQGALSPPAIEQPTAAPSVALPPVIASLAAPNAPAKPGTASPQEDPRTAAIRRGQQLWQLRRGPRHAALSECDLGLGAGRVVGTFAHLPRHFADADRVMDLETRLLWCARAQQELEPASLMLPHVVDGGMTSELEDLAAYVASLSISWRLSPPQAHARERQAQVVGQALYARRQGPLDFSCASCHGPAGQPPPATISGAGRAQTLTMLQGRALPQLGQPPQARAAIAAWPAWRLSQGGVRMLRSRLAACFWHMGMEPPAQGSDSLIALVAYLTKLAENGEVLASGRRP